MQTLQLWLVTRHIPEGKSLPTKTIKMCVMLSWKQKLKIHIQKRHAKLDTMEPYSNQNNSYFKALRWASDRITTSGVIGFITPSSYITGNAEAGIRATLREEFTDIWCLDLRGQKDVSQDGRNIFEYKGSSEGGTTQGVAVTILIKNPNKSGHRVHYTKTRCVKLLWRTKTESHQTI